MFKAAGFTFLSKIGAAGFNFLVIVLLSHFLSITERGDAAFYVVIIAISLALTDSVAGALAGNLMLRFKQRQIRTMSYTWCAAVAFVVCGLFCISGKISPAEAGLLFLACWLNGANNLHVHILLGSQRFQLFNFFNVILPVTTLLFCLLCVCFNVFEKKIYLLCLCSAWLAGFIATSIILLKMEDEREVVPWRQLIAAGWQLGSANQAGHLAGLFNSRILYVILPAGSLGLFSNAQALAEAMLMLPGSLGQILYSSTLNAQSGKNRKSSLWRSLILNFALMAVIILVLIALPGHFFGWIFGRNFLGIKPLLMVLSLGSFVQSGYLIISYWHSAHGKFWLNFYPLAIGSFINLACCVFLHLSNNLTVLNGTYCLLLSYFVIGLVTFYLLKKESAASNYHRNDSSFM